MKHSFSALRENTKLCFNEKRRLDSHGDLCTVKYNKACYLGVVDTSRCVTWCACTTLIDTGRLLTNRNCTFSTTRHPEQCATSPATRKIHCPSLSSLYGIRSLGYTSLWYSHFVSELGFRSRGLGSDPGRGRCVVVLGKVLACKTGVIFCVFQEDRGESEASSKCELSARGGALLSSHAARACLAFVWNTQEMRKKITPDLASKVLTLAVPLSTQVCEWVPLGKSVMLGVALCWAIISARASGNRNVTSYFMLQKPG